MENPPFEDVFPIQDGDFPFTGGYLDCEPKGLSLGNWNNKTPPS